MSFPITNKKMPKNTKPKILCKVDAFSLSKIFPISPIESMAIMTADIILKKPINKPRIKPLYFIELNITFNTQNKDKNRPTNNILIVDSFSAIELFSLLCYRYPRIIASESGCCSLNFVCVSSDCGETSCL